MILVCLAVIVLTLSMMRQQRYMNMQRDALRNLALRVRALEDESE